MKSLISLFAVAWFVTNVAGDVVFDGLCSQFNVTDLTDFCKESLMGNWFLYAVYDYAAISDYNCIRVFYKLDPAGNGETVEYYVNVEKQELLIIDSLMIFEKPNTGFYVYNIPTDGTVDNVHIVTTDYTHYYIEFSCSDIDGKSDCYVGVFTRSPCPDEITLQNIEKDLDDHGLDDYFLRYIVQDANICKY